MFCLSFRVHQEHQVPKDDKERMEWMYVSDFVFISTVSQDAHCDILSCLFGYLRELNAALSKKHIDEKIEESIDLLKSSGAYMILYSWHPLFW